MKANKINQVVFLLMSLAIFGCSSNSATNTEEIRKVLVRVQPTGMQSASQSLEFTGVVQAFEEAHIAPGTPARINRILVDVGDKVKKGQLLVEMDHTQLFQSEVQLENLRKELARMDTLLRAGAVTQQSYDQLKTQYEVAKSSIGNLKTHTEIRSTLNGVVTGRYHSEGELFTMTPGPAGKPAIVTVHQVQPVKVTLGISERFLPEVYLGQQAIITTDVFPAREFEGKIHKIFPTIDRASGTFRVEVVIDNKDETLRPGMFSRVSIQMGEHEALLVPSMAILKQAGSNERFVFVVEHNKAQRISVRPGRIYGEFTEVLSGLEAGQTLVVSGQHNLIHQAEVEIVQ
jgi:membrane fusion protein, multidrug efflux system